MIIEYLQTLRDTPQRNFPNEGISETEIAQLEQSYNSGNPFPKVLKELLFLAGNYCNWLDYSVYDNQQELQDEVRAELQDIYSETISRPHFIVDTVPDGTFVFMYLDEGDNPPLYHSNIITESNSSEVGKGSLKVLIEKRIQLHLEGYNPF
ncbi:MAG: hypothetical protein AB8H03_20055 [Saprospiraceae bacterium]